MFQSKPLLVILLPLPINYYFIVYKDIMIRVYDVE